MGSDENHGDSAISYCKTILQDLVALWPKPDRNEPPDFHSRLRHLLAKDFDEIDFLNRIEGIRTWVEERDDSASGEISLQFDDTGGYPQKAIFIRQRGRDWLLKSLKFLCPVCFGTGENDNEVCSICDGLGWGAGASQ